MIYFHEAGEASSFNGNVTHGHDYHGVSYWYSLTGRRASGVLTYAEALMLLEPATPNTPRRALQLFHDVMERRIDRAFAKYFLGRTSHS